MNASIRAAARLPRGRRDHRACGSLGAVAEDSLRLGSTGQQMYVIHGRDRPLASLLLGEDACWQFARLDWRRRRPRIWDVSRRRVWKQEGRQLEAKRRRLVALATELPMSPHHTAR